MARASDTLAAEDYRLWAKAGTGPMQKHSWFEFEVSRVLNLAQNVPCLLVKAEKLGCCRME